jgi:hypothetical protein
MSNTAYLLQYGINSETPATLELMYGYGQRDEFIKVAIPYPSGSTFNFTDSNMADQSAWTAVNSVSEVGAPATYFYDETNKLLWLTMKFREEYYLQAFDRKWYDNYIYVTIRASCPGGSCTQDVNPASISHGLIPPPPESICESGGGIENGDIVWTAKDGGSMNVFTDELDPAWTLYSWIDGIANVTSDAGADGTSKSIQVDLNSYWSLGFRRADDKVVVNPSFYTHLEFKVRLAPGRSVLRNWIGLVGMNKQWDVIDEVKWKSVDIESPWYGNDAPIDDQHWSTVRVPVVDLGFHDIGDIFSFRFWSAESPRTTLVYFDEIKFVNYDSSVNPMEAALEVPAVDNAHVKYVDPLGALVQVDVQTPDTAVITGDDDKKSTAKESLPTWALALLVVLAILAVAGIVGVIVLVIKMRAAAGKY